MTDIHRHDISDDIWSVIEAHLPGSIGNRGRRARDNRLFFNAIIWKLRTGTPWRDLPPQYGHWKSVSNRFYSWRDRGVFDRLLQLVSQDPDLEWLMIDASHIKAHPHACGAKGGAKVLPARKAA